MNIFIGGMKQHHQQRFVAEFPEVSFTFAAFDDPHNVWMKEARKADVVIVDQSRCSHGTMEAFKKAGKRPIMTDSKAIIRNIVREVIAHGSVNHAYTRSAGSESVAYVPAYPVALAWFSLPGSVPEAASSHDNG